MRRSPRRLALLAVPALVLLLPACGGDGGSDEPAAPGHVNVLDNFFDPETLDVSVGDTVTWDFKGGAAHNVIADDFKSKTLGKGKTFTYTFNTAGTYDYTCTLHNGMDGTVVVS
jgi:plastocyanin